MGRKPNPRGKDKTRTISLDGDVGEIAQRLADKGQLSSTISDALRRQFGIDTQLDKLKLELNNSIDERKALQEKEESLIHAINMAEQISIERRTTLIPQLENQKHILADRHEKLIRDKSRCITEQDRILKQRQIDLTADRLKDVMQQMKEANA